MKHHKVIVWFRNDLRLHDHAALFYACENAEEVVPVYCFDPRHFAPTFLGLPKTGSFRAKFLWESVNALKRSLIQIKSNLILLVGHPEIEIPKLGKSINAKSIYFSQEVTDEEIKVEKALEEKAWSEGIGTESYWQHTLYHLDDLPFPVNQTPEVFTQFRKVCEKMSEIRPTLPFPKIPVFQEKKLANTDLPCKSQFGIEEENLSSKAVLAFKGGELEGQKRLNHYFWTTNALKSYKETRNGLLGENYSSKFSPWLALGCLSPRFVYQEVVRYEKERHKNQSTYWLIFELIWRDYFRFICKKHGNKVFQIQGIKNQLGDWDRNEAVFENWKNGLTGVPFVDANMRELNQTGFMSNRGRQIVASFLVNDLNIDWTWGAQYFECKLIDYDVCSNWGNWMYVGGVGNDPRENRYFNILRQGKNYDKEGEYVRTWVPELQKIKGFEIHNPHELDKQALKQNGISKLENQYPSPLVSFKRWL
jgi:deoxyribodipyrimidine photo-lyase